MEVYVRFTFLQLKLACSAMAYRLHFSSHSTSLSSMTKRPLEPIPSCSEIPQPARVCKRPRTERFLERVALFENAMQTCAFFRDELNFCASVQPLVDGEKRDPLTATPESLRIAESTFQKYMIQYAERFETSCETLAAEADENIRLADSFRCVSRAIESEEDASSGIRAGLSTLNQGPETNAFIKYLIESFSGVPSEDDAADWRALRLLLPTR